MFPRLAVTRHQPHRDGAILVSIDSREVYHLRLLLDATLGGGNFGDLRIRRGARKGASKLTGGKTTFSPMLEIANISKSSTFVGANGGRALKLFMPKLRN